ncbi:MAG: hypothetical protein ACTHJP_00005, partial [Rhodanobacteraceae bacterium]
MAASASPACDSLFARFNNRAAMGERGSSVVTIREGPTFVFPTPTAEYWRLCQQSSSREKN